MATPTIPNLWLDQPYATPQMLVKIGRRRRLNLLIAGEGGPTVIFAPGLNETMLSWARVQPAVGLATRSVAFDKAGMGFSDAGPLPRTASAAVEDLRAALAVADIAPPYVLAGHSAGGLYMRLFAFRYPKDVVGMVMVDSSSEHQYRRFGEALGDSAAELAIRRDYLHTYSRLARLAREGALAPGTPDFDRAVGPLPPTLTAAVRAARIAQRTSPAFWRTLRSESAATYGPDGSSISSDEVAAARTALGETPLGDMPLIVLTAGRSPQPRPGDTGAQTETRRRLWQAMHDEIAALSTRGERRTIADSGHYMTVDKPEAVIAALEEVLALARAA
jgi:pimeloyl-ACP methyl ester carboxylesterase